MEHYLGVAEAEGISEEEIVTIRSIVMAVQAGRVRAQLRRVRQRPSTRKPS